MDYGQPNQNEVNNPFSTGNLPSAGLENAKWGGSEADPSRDQNQNFGKNAINGQLVENPNQSINLEAFATEPNATADFGPAPVELGQIIETEPAPVNISDENPGFDQNAIRVDGESLSSKTIEIIDDMEKQLNKTGDAASFVEEFEQAKIANLKNSYNRTFGDS